MCIRDSIYSMRGPRNGPRTPPAADNPKEWRPHSPRRGQSEEWARHSSAADIASGSLLQLDGVADFGHGRDRDLPRPLAALVEDLHDLGRLVDVALPPLADLGQRRQHVLEQHALAVEAADGRGAASRRALLPRPLRREDAVQVEHRADVGIAGILSLIHISEPTRQAEISYA